MKKIVYIFVITFILGACNSNSSNKVEEKEQTKTIISTQQFSEDSCYNFIVKQLSFGFRVPNTAGHKACAEYLVETFKSYKATVFVQEGEVTAFDGNKLKIKNIIASYNPTNKKRVLLSAHWDSRPFADQDSKDQGSPIPAANDAGSGVAVLLEMARLFSIQSPNVGVDIILFDAEDYGQPEGSKFPEMQDSYCLGSQYWGKNPPTKGYQPLYGILLDMVGGENLTFYQEEISRKYAQPIVDKVWNIANNIGYSENFLFKPSSAIIDDHYYVNILANIPMIDLIHHDESSTSGFWKYWHTHDDKIENISKKSLKAVGQTLVEVIYNEK